MPFFTRDRAPSADDTAGPAVAAPPSTEATVSGLRRAEDLADQVEHDDQVQAAQSQPESFESTSSGLSGKEVAAHNSKMNGTAAVMELAIALEEGRLGEAEHDQEASVDDRPQEGEVYRKEGMLSSGATQRIVPSAARSNEQHEPAAQATLDSMSRDPIASMASGSGGIPIAIADSQADEASQAAGLISAESKPQSSSQAELPQSAHSPATAIEVLATAGSHEPLDGSLGAELDGQGRSNLLVPASLAPQLASMQNAEYSRQEIAEAAAEALSNEADSLEGTAVLGQTQMDQLIYPEIQHSDEGPSTRPDPIASPNSSASALPEGKQLGDRSDLAAEPANRENDAAAEVTDLLQVPPLQGSSPRDDSSRPQRSANAIEEMLRKVQKEEWDTG